MSLFQFLMDNRDEVLAISEKKTIALAALRPVSEELKSGLPVFFDQLIVVLKKNSAKVSVHDEQDILDASGEHGKELLRLGYTLSHVVHSYGAICQGITELASARQAPVTALEFHNLNRCLDIAIAGAVTEFESVRSGQIQNREVESLGMMAHELRNALNRAVVSSEMIIKGIVGTGGSTAKVLAYSLGEMGRLIDRALSEVRLRADSGTHEEFFPISELISQLVVTAEVDASQRGLTLTLDIEPNLNVNTDRHLMLSAIGNLVQNAMKFTKPKSNITVSARSENEKIVIDVRDQCGGIPAEKLTEMFKPFVQQGKDRSGLGLGLLISRKAIEKCKGTLNVANIPGGCEFKISIPSAKAVVNDPFRPVV